MNPLPKNLENCLAVFDLETTGINPEADRIVSAYLAVLRQDGTVVAEHDWLVDPGIEIPEGATAVHGITTDRARSEGMDPGDAVVQIGTNLADIITREIPLVIYNAPYDLTLLDREIRRNGIEGGTWFPLERIIDPLVLDKAMDQFRKGSRRLADVVKHYAGPHFIEPEWHGAQADARAAGYLARLLLADHRLVNASPDEIHRWSTTWHRRQAESFAEYLTRQGKDASDVDPAWPIVPWRES